MNFGSVTISLDLGGGHRQKLAVEIFEVEDVKGKAVDPEQLAAAIDKAFAAANEHAARTVRLYGYEGVARAILEGVPPE